MQKPCPDSVHTLGSGADSRPEPQVSRDGAERPATRAAYNPCMLHALFSTAQTALVERAALFVNHVIAAEPAAVERLRAHAGCCMELQVDGWPNALPTLPPLCFRVTPAGLVEWCGTESPVAVDLVVRLDASNPARLAAQWARGERPRIDIQGDAQFATDCDWLLAHLRWDAEDDLARLVGAAPARIAAQAGAVLASGLRGAARTVSQWAGRSGDGRGGAEPGAR